jgi:hypothetical protein
MQAWNAVKELIYRSFIKPLHMNCTLSRNYEKTQNNLFFSTNYDTSRKQSHELPLLGTLVFIYPYNKVQAKKAMSRQSFSPRDTKK